MTGYYRRFVQNYASIAEPLTELTKIEWTAKSELAFQRLKKVLVSAPLMKNPDFARTFILQTDSSGVGVGAVLSQGEKEDLPISVENCYLVRKHTTVAYSTVEKECLSHCARCKTLQGLLVRKIVSCSDGPQSVAMATPI